jgi:hypothetical protein
VKTEILLGPYASHLKYLGQDTETAMRSAREIGEVATQRTVLVTTRQLTGEEMHERYLGNLDTPATTYKILAEAPVANPTAQAGSKAPKPSAM